MAFYGLLWSCMALHGLVWPCMALYGLAWPCMALYGLVWPSLAFYGLLWQNIVFSRGHRSKFIWSCFSLLLNSNNLYLFKTLSFVSASFFKKLKNYQRPILPLEHEKENYKLSLKSPRNYRKIIKLVMIHQFDLNYFFFNPKLSYLVYLYVYLKILAHFFKAKLLFLKKEIILE